MTDPVGGDARPRLAAGHRLQWEKAQDTHVLLYPEGMVKLNATAAQILQRCDGNRSVSELVSELETEFGQTGLGPDVETFLTEARHRRWIDVG